MDWNAHSASINPSTSLGTRSNVGMAKPSPPVRQAGNIGRLLVIHGVCRRSVPSACPQVKYRCRCRDNRFELIKWWGSGKRASADGTKWDVYEQNLLSEYHIRYGGWGGVGYYHVSDTYIVLFSSFIACGVWEAIYILDGLLENRSEIRPDTLHADTQGRSEPVFGLAYLLAIRLMPRIRNWKHLNLYMPSDQFAVEQIEHMRELFSGAIDWTLMKTHLPDM